MRPTRIRVKAMTKMWDPLFRFAFNRGKIELIDERIKELQELKKRLEAEGMHPKGHSMISMDLGSSKIVIMKNDKIIIEEPAVIAYMAPTRQVIAVGNEANERCRMQHMKLIHPMKEEEGTDFNCIESLLKGFTTQGESLNKWHKREASNRKRNALLPTSEIAVGISLNCTYAKRRCIQESLENIGFKKVHMIPEAIAAAVGMGMEIQKTRGRMIIDLGGGWTQIAVISLGGIVVGKTIAVGGDNLTWAIKKGLQVDFHIGVSLQIAEKIKLNIGSAFPTEETKKYTLRGLHLYTAEPLEIVITAKDIAKWIDEPLKQIENGITTILESISPELFNDIANYQIALTGGGALLLGIANRLQERTKIKVTVADDPLHLVARSVGLALQYEKEFAKNKK